DKPIIQHGYLDVGIMDTMKVLFVNFIGAVVISVFGYLYSRNDYEKFTFIKNFIPKKIKRFNMLKNKRRGSDYSFVSAPSFLKVW
ncbi:hypothetical protein AAH990_15145, partial [Enterococcus lactis]